MYTPILFLIISYLIGSVSFAIVVCRLMGLPDPRSQGSGNPGATNVMRIGGKKASIMVFAGDFLKGVIAISLALFFDLDPLWVNVCAVMVLLGHIFPIFFKGQGGKALATLFGVIVMLSPLAAIISLLLWILLVKLTRISSVGAIGACLLLPSVAYVSAPDYWVGLTVCAMLVLLRHHKNIRALIAGSERKF